MRTIAMCWQPIIHMQENGEQAQCTYLKATISARWIKLVGRFATHTSIYGAFHGDIRRILFMRLHLNHVARIFLAVVPVSKNI